MMTKAEKYEAALAHITAILDLEAGPVANLANIVAVIHTELCFFWTGWYEVKENAEGVCELVLGPFQGPPACIHIGYGRGVCGTAWKEKRTIVVPDVEEFPGHIACSSLSRSEIVVPVFKNGEMVAELDIDSRHLATFDETDALWLSKVTEIASVFFRQ